MSLDTPSIQKIDGTDLRIAVLASRYNEALVDSLVHHTCEVLETASTLPPLIDRVPGAAELPYAVATLAAHARFDAMIAIGVVIAGDTNHHNIIGESTAHALQEISIRERMPVINGILVVNNLAQAEARAGETINRGKEFAQAALEMALFTKKWKTNPNQ